jgi:UDP-2,3-diacylglucosamine hydrolase
MHLGDHDPQTAELFFSSLASHTGAITHLFLLGDIFEAWVGDDQPDQVAAQLCDRLSGLAARGVRVLLMRGNRDFLLGVVQCNGAAASWPARCNAELLQDPTVVDLFGAQVLLAHGDAWCTDDHDYQRFRTEVRTPSWQQAFLARPLDERLAMARAMREQSERNKLQNDPGDVSGDAVARDLEAAHATRVLHGHTHRPGRYPLPKHRQSAEPPERWVLTDWLGASGRGGWLAVSRNGWERFEA